MDTITRAYFRLRGTTRRSRRSQSGQGMVEYALIFLCVALVLIVVVGVIGHQVNNSYSNVATQFP